MLAGIGKEVAIEAPPETKTEGKGDTP